MTSARPDPGPPAVVAAPRTGRLGSGTGIRSGIRPVDRHRRPRPPVLLALFVVLVWLASQTQAGVHALGHLLEGDADACPICQLAGAPPLPSLSLDAPAPLPPGRALAPAKAPERPPLRPSRAHRARAPPS